MVGRRTLERVGSVSEPSRDVRVFHFGFACMLQLVTVEDYNWRCKCVSAVSFQNIQYICSANCYSVNRHFIGQKFSTLRIISGAVTKMGRPTAKCFIFRAFYLPSSYIG